MIFVTINEFTLDNKLIESLNLYTSMDSLYYGGVLTIKDGGGLLFSDKNNVAIGSDVVVTIYDDIVEQNSIGAFGFKIAKAEVTHIKQGRAEETAFGKSISLEGYLTLHLISPWFFDQKIESHAYVGTFSEIAYKVLTTDGYKPNINLTNTSDVPSIRYRIKEGGAQFLQRIQKYGLIQNNAVYLWSDFNQEIYIRSLQDLLAIDPSIIITPIADGLNPEGKFKYQLSEANAYVGIENTYEGIRNLQYVSPIFSELEASKDLKSKIPVSISNKKGPTQKDLFPISIPKTTVTGAIMNSWHYSPFDQIASTINFTTRSYDDYNSLVIAIPYIVIDALPGLPVAIRFEKEDTPYIEGDVKERDLHWMSGTYVIKHVEHCLSGKNNPFTKLLIVRV